MEIVVVVADIPVHINGWVIFLVALFTFDATLYLKRVNPGSANASYVKYALIASIIVIFSTIVHEAGHAIVARMAGFSVSEASVTAFGAYVRPDATLEQLGPLNTLLLSFVGPLTNFVLAALFAIPVWILGESLHENTLQYVSMINFRLGWFNLLPIVGFDGSKVLMSILWRITGNLDLGIAITLGATVVTIILIIIYFSRSTILSRVEKGLERL